MQPDFGEDILELRYMDTDAFIFSFKQNKGTNKDLKHLEKFLILGIWIHHVFRRKKKLLEK